MHPCFVNSAISEHQLFMMHVHGGRLGRLGGMRDREVAEAKQKAKAKAVSKRAAARADAERALMTPQRRRHQEAGFLGEALNAFGEHTVHCRFCGNEHLVSHEKFLSLQRPHSKFSCSVVGEDCQRQLLRHLVQRPLRPRARL